MCVTPFGSERVRPNPSQAPLGPVKRNFLLFAGFFDLYPARCGAAERILERRLPGDRPSDPAEYAAAVRHEAQARRHKFH